MKREIIWYSEPCRHFHISKTVIRAGTVRFELIPKGQLAGIRYATKREAMEGAEAGCRAKHCSRAMPRLLWECDMPSRRTYTSGEWRIESRVISVGGRNMERMWDLKRDGEHLNYYETVPEAKAAAERAERGANISAPEIGHIIAQRQGMLLRTVGERVRQEMLLNSSDWNTAGDI